MISDATMQRLRWHAGLDSGPTGPGFSVSRCVWSADRSAQHLDDALDDLIVVMGTLNNELNGASPSVTTDGPDEIPRQAAYAVAEIARMLREQPGGEPLPRGTPDWGRAAWRVDAAWRAVLAGDIDDLPAHLADEEAMGRT